MHMSRSIAMTAMMIALAAGSAAAQGKGQENRQDKPAKAQPAKRVDRAPEARRTQPVNQARRADEGRAIGHTAAPPKGGTPPGQGGTPPGQLKKMYRTDDGLWTLRDVLRRRGYTVTRLSRANDARYVYYRLPDGTIRRAAVLPGSDRLQFTNVPEVVLREVIARLY